MADGTDQDPRVAELEAEVARLRRRLGEDEEATPRESAPASPATPTDVVEGDGFQVSRGKVIGLAVVIALLALTAFAAIFFTLSSGVDSLAKKAAKSFVPEAPEPGSDDRGTGSGSAPPPSGPVAPGL